jgi:hypothetical protein
MEGSCLIRFVLVNPKEEITDNYIETLLTKLNSDKNHLIKECEIIDSTNIMYPQWKLKLTTNKENVYFIEISLQTYNNSKHLFIDIASSKKTKNFDKDLFDVKINIKNLIRHEWEECVWLEDEQSYTLAEELYSKIHRTENRLRQFINIVMIRNFGVKWWEKYTPKKIQDKYKARFSSYKRVAQSYANVSDHLMSIDTDDLLTIMGHKLKKFAPNKSYLVVNLLESIREVGDITTIVSEYKKVIDKLKSECEVEIDLWEHIFKKYFPDDFKNHWEDFCKNRNHIAHNKLIDLNAYDIINDNIEKVKEYIENAEREFNKSNLSDEEKEFLLELEEIRKAELKLAELEIIESEAGISILDTDEIVEIFKENVENFIKDVKDSIYFRNDLEIDTSEFTQKDTQELLTAVSKITGNKVTINALLDLNEGSGECSTVTLELYANDELIDRCDLTYTNGEAEFDEEQGCYMPVHYNKFSKGRLDDFTDNVFNTIEQELPYLVNKVDSIIAEVIRKGGKYPVSDSDCEECGEKYICIDDSICKVGICVNCGHENELNECLRCGKLYNPNTEGNLDLCGECEIYVNDYY